MQFIIKMANAIISERVFKVPMLTSFSSLEISNIKFLKIYYNDFSLEALSYDFFKYFFLLSFLFPSLTPIAHVLQLLKLS